MDLTQIHLGFQWSESMDLKSPHKPKNLEIPRPHARALFSILHWLQKLCHALSSSPKLFFFLSFLQQGLSLSTFFFLFILSISLFLLNLNHKGSRVLCGFLFYFFFGYIVSFSLLVANLTFFRMLTDLIPRSKTPNTKYQIWKHNRNGKKR